MSHQALSDRPEYCATAWSAAHISATPTLAGDAAFEPHATHCRRPDGSIDIDHYDCITRDLRARAQHATLKTLIAPVHWLLGATRYRMSTWIRAIFRSETWQPGR